MSSAPETAPPIYVEVNLACERWPTDLIERLGEVADYVAAAAGDDWPTGETSVSVLLTDDDDMANLNKQWRDKEGPTNVLSFPAFEGFVNPDAQGQSLGDIAIGLSIAEREAQEAGKSLADHVTHLWVHGLLHLIGHDHIEEDEAEEMEAIEISILAQLGIDDPYK